MVSCAVSLVLVEADDVGVLSEASSADVHVVFADEALTGSADPAGTTVLAISAGMGSPEEVGHACGNYNTEYYLLNFQPIFLHKGATTLTIEQQLDGTTSKMQHQSIILESKNGHKPQPAYLLYARACRWVALKTALKEFLALHREELRNLRLVLLLYQSCEFA